MAEVFLALKTGPGGFQRRVVVKCLHEHLCGNPDAENRFVEEAVLGSHLEHDNIVRVMDLARSGGRLYMILDHVDGMDLRRLLSAAGALPLAVVLHIGRELARGLHYAHTLVDTAGRPLNLVHRDVSPSNILLSSQGQVKLTDFGVAKALGREETRGGVVKGKYGYMSPQQVQQQPLDASSDQFSLATVLLESLTGASVFVGAGPLQIMEKVLEGSVPEIPAAHREALPDLEALLGRMLALEPKDRLADTRAVARVLSEMLARLEAHAPHEELAALVRKVMSRTSEHAEDNTSDTQSATLDELAVSGRPESETDHYGPPLGAPSAPPDAASPRPDDDTSQYRIAQLEPTQGAATDRPVHEP